MSLGLDGVIILTARMVLIFLSLLMSASGYKMEISYQGAICTDVLFGRRWRHITTLFRSL